MPLRKAPIDRVMDELEIREARARAALNEARGRPEELTEIDALNEQRNNLNAHLATARSQLSAAEAALMEHDRRRPGAILGRLSGSLADHERKRVALAKRVEKLRTTEVKTRAALTKTETLALAAHSRWNANMASVMQSRRDQEQAAHNDLAVYADARQIAQRNTLLAAAGADAVVALVRCERERSEPLNSWNGLAWTDQWGIGQLGPSPLI
jgi:chromosome segregation ATPase